MKKQIIFAMLSIVLALSLTFASCDNGTGGSTGGDIDESVLNQVQYVEANPAKGFNFGYYYYIPQSIRNAAKKYLLVEPNNTGTVSDDIAVHAAAAQRIVNGMMYWASELGAVLLVPVFPRPQTNWQMYTHALDRDTLLNKTGELARVDLQLIRMTEDLKNLCKGFNINLETKILMDGFSASGNFVARFTAIHPELVQAVAAGGMGGLPILPTGTLEGERLIYPVGIADIGEITGAPFNFERYVTVPQFIYLGSADENDALPYADSFGDEERRIITKVLGTDKFVRWDKSIRVYEEQGCSSVIFKTYPGVGHTITNAMAEDIIAFFRSNM